MTGLPLAGRRVVVTRAEHQAEGLAEALAAAGADVQRLPLLAVLPPEDPRPLAAAAASVDSFERVIFTSTNAVQAFFAELAAPWPAAVWVGAIGVATDAALCERNVWPNFIADPPTAEGLLEELVPKLRPGERILLPQAADARPTLAEGLRAAGADITAPVAYHKTLPPGAAKLAGQIFGEGDLGWVTFTSPSIVRAFAGLFTPHWTTRRRTLRAASIGPVTSEALRALGVPPAAEAATASDAALVEAIAARVGHR
jgi:uroporphyrinogen-III synthase